MNATPIALQSSQTWTYVFTTAAYVMTVMCVFGGTRRAASGRVGGHVLLSALGQLVLFAFLAVACWAVESYAHLRTPYYLYAREFPDLVGRMKLDSFVKIIGPPVVDQCTKIVTGDEAFLSNWNDRIPLAVILFESSLIYAAMWTGRLLEGRPWTQPLLAGLVLVNVDAMLDPVVAQSHGCAAATFAPTQWCGLGLWHWFVPSNTSESNSLLATLFEVPVFNFVAWWAAPVVLVSVVTLINDGLGTRARRRLRLPTSENEQKREWRLDAELLTFCVLLFGLVVVIRAAPNSGLGRPWQYAIATMAVAASLFFFFRQFGNYTKVDAVDFTLTLPPALSLLLPAVATILGGQALRQPALMPVVALSVALGLWLAWLPYHAALESFARSVGVVDRFVRMHFFGFTSMLVLFGGALGSPDPKEVSLKVVGGLFLVAAAFHVFTYVFNDVVDLPLDRQDSRRRSDPLVSEKISLKSAAGTIAAVVVAAMLATLFLTRFQVHVVARWIAWAFLGSAFGLMSIYDLLGKRCPWPVVTDALEGVAWGCLAFFGFFATCDLDYASAVRANWHGLAALALSGALFILLINGIHGGLRDAVNDKRNHKFTTALWLGAETKVTEAGSSVVRGNLGICCFAFTVHTLLFAVLGWFIITTPDDFARIEIVLGANLALFALSSWALWKVVQRDNPDRDWWISAHVFVVLLPGLVTFICDTRPNATFKWSVALTFFLPLLFRESVLTAIIDAVYRNDTTQVRRATLSLAGILHGRSSAGRTPPSGCAPPDPEGPSPQGT